MGGTAANRTRFILTDIVAYSMAEFVVSMSFLPCNLGARAAYLSMRGNALTRRSLLFTAAGTAAFAQTTRQVKTPIPVAFVISPGAVVIDYTGPWEVFQDAVVPGHARPFSLYTVAERVEPIPTSGGMKVVPNYSFADAPQPKIIVIPAQQGGAAVQAWLLRAAPVADLTMSVCTGALHLAKTGLLDGKSATTHHSAYV